MRTLNVLYGLLLTRFLESKEKNYLAHESPYICDNIGALEIEGTITVGEEEKLRKHFAKNQPSSVLHKEFFIHPSYTYYGLGWWTKDDEGAEQRVLFLQFLVSKDWGKKKKKVTFPVKVMVTAEMLKGSDIMDNRNCPGARALKSVLPKYYAKSVSWGASSGSFVDADGERVLVTAHRNMMWVDSPTEVTLSLEKF